MKIIALGTGSAFTIPSEGEIQNYQSNFVIESDNGKKLLIDAGGDVRFSLRSSQIDLVDISDIYISHLHADHIGGLEYIGLCSKFNPSDKKKNLYISNFLTEPLWESLRGGMRSLQGESTTLESYFNLKEIGRNGYFFWEGIKFSLIQTIHVVDEYFFMPSFGLLFQYNGKTIFITTDTQFCPHQIKDFYNIADLILHDCETTPYKSGVHAHYDDLKTLGEDIKKKMWLYHYNPGKLPDAKTDGFLGFLARGEIIEL